MSLVELLILALLILGTAAFVGFMSYREVRRHDMK